MPYFIGLSPTPMPTFPPWAIDMLFASLAIVAIISAILMLIFTIAVGWDIHKRKSQSNADETTRGKE